MNNRGQSEVLGFIFIFSVVILSIGLLVTTGAGNLSGLQDTATTDNAQNAMQILSDNLKEIHQRNAPSRATEVRLADTSLETTNNSNIRVLDENNNEILDYDTDSQRVLEYQTEQGTIVYDSGALIREDAQGGSIMVDDPPFRFTDNTVLINDVKLTGDFTRFGSETLLLVGEEREKQSEVVNEDIQIVIETTDDQAVAWENYFLEQDRIDDSNVIRDDGTVTVEIEYSSGDNFILRQSEIRMGVE